MRPALSLRALSFALSPPLPPPLFLLRGLGCPEEQTYPVEYLAFEGVRFLNQWVLPPPSPGWTANTLQDAAPSLPRERTSNESGDGREERWERQHRVWGEGIEKTVLPHVLLVQGLPNASTEVTLQGLDKFLVRLSVSREDHAIREGLDLVASRKAMGGTAPLSRIPISREQTN